MIMTAMVNPLLVVLGIVIAVIVRPIQAFLAGPVNQLVELTSQAKNRQIQHVINTFDGLSTIRALGCESQFVSDFTDMSTDCLTTGTLRMFAYRMNSAVYNSFCAMYTAFFYFSLIWWSDYFNETQVGLALASIITIQSVFECAIGLTTILQETASSVGKVLAYTKLEPEEDRQAVASHELHRFWPQSGTIEFHKVSLSYNGTNEEQPKKVLKNITFSVKNGEKIGIVGRTGAGKSSLINVLFRIKEFDGHVSVDNVDTKTIPLDWLRQAISIIPQDPVLFSGSVRSNLDPFDELDDKQLWQCLRDANLEEAISSMDNGLDSCIEPGGSNLSTGQKQLMCLARALVRKRRILVLDEATANVDNETDQVIQKTIRTKFADYTVLTIAHRINTIIDFDRVMVIDNGEILEFDSPQVLLDKKGRFYEMAKKAKLVNN